LGLQPNLHITGVVGSTGGGEFLRTKTEERSLPYFRNGTDRRKAAKARR
jgi:hypothetical protein